VSALRTLTLLMLVLGQIGTTFAIHYLNQAIVAQTEILRVHTNMLARALGQQEDTRHTNELYDPTVNLTPTQISNCR
jgi:hypothetical protein